MLGAKNSEEVFNSGYRKVLFANILNTTVSAVNFMRFSKNALSMAQFGMESTDLAMAALTKVTHRRDKNGEHVRASKLRQRLYELHATTAAAGMAESVYYWGDKSEISYKGLALSAIVGILNLDALSTIYRQKRGIVEPVDQVVVPADNEEVAALAGRAIDYDGYNTRAISNIAITNVIEAGAGIAGAGFYALYDQSPSVFAFTGSLGVGVFMAKQIIAERQFRRSF